MSGEVAILGAGVMGGSLARALSLQGREVRVWTPDFNDAAQAGALPGVSVASDAASAVRGVDGVVVATPLSALSELVPTLASAAEGAWIQDVVSLQQAPLAAADAATLTGNWVSAHPMAGGHLSGFAGSRDDLYQGVPVWLSDQGADPGIRAAAQRFWERLGAEPEWIDAEEHDARMIGVSHLPQVVAVALARVLAESGYEADHLGPGGRDTTRLAGSGAGMWADLFAESGGRVAPLLRALAAELGREADALEAGRLEEIVAAFRVAGEWRGR